MYGIDIQIKGFWAGLTIIVAISAYFVTLFYCMQMKDAKATDKRMIVNNEPPEPTLPSPFVPRPDF
jgi:hypothetical protein